MNSVFPVKRVGDVDDVVQFLKLKPGKKGRQQAYRMVNEIFPRGVVIRLGRHIRFDLDALAEWASKGGTAQKDDQQSS